MGKEKKLLKCSCGKLYRVSSSGAGKRIICKSCGSTLQISATNNAKTEIQSVDIGEFENSNRETLGRIVILAGVIMVIAAAITAPLTISRNIKNQNSLEKYSELFTSAQAALQGNKREEAIVSLNQAIALTGTHDKSEAESVLTSLITAKKQEDAKKAATLQEAKRRKEAVKLRAEAEIKAAKSKPPVTENGSYYGEVSETTGRPKTVFVNGYYRKDGTYVRSHYRSPPLGSSGSRAPPTNTPVNDVAENGSYYGEISETTERPKTVHVGGYYRKNGTYVRGHYRSRPRK